MLLWQPGGFKPIQHGLLLLQQEAQQQLQPQAQHQYYRQM
jgi:hypothetical protein